MVVISLGAMRTEKFISYRKSHGFTLVELILVLAILAILSATAVTKMDVFGRDLDSEARVLRSNLQLAQDLAMTGGQTYGFRMLTTTSYEIYVGSPGNPAKNPLTNGNFVINMSPIQFFGTVSPIAYASNGRPNLVANVTVVLTNGTSYKNVNVQQNTGFIAVTSTP